MTKLDSRIVKMFTQVEDADGFLSQMLDAAGRRDAVVLVLKAELDDGSTVQNTINGYVRDFRWEDDLMRTAVFSVAISDSAEDGTLTIETNKVGDILPRLTLRHDFTEDESGYWRVEVGDSYFLVIRVGIRPHQFS